jgi:hypothetical protein
MCLSCADGIANDDATEHCDCEVIPVVYEYFSDFLQECCIVAKTDKGTFSAVDRQIITRFYENWNIIGRLHDKVVPDQEKTKMSITKIKQYYSESKKTSTD